MTCGSAPFMQATPLVASLLKCFGDSCWVVCRETGRELHRGEGLSWVTGCGALHNLGFVCVASRRAELLEQLREQRSLVQEPVPLQTPSGEQADGLLSIELVSDSGRELVVGRLERHAASDRVEQLNRMAKLGELCMGIAHEIRTPMAAIFSTQATLKEALDRVPGALDAVSQDVAQDAAVQRLFGVLRTSAKVIGDGSERVRDIISQIRSYGCPGPRHIAEVDINQIVKDTLALVQCEIGSHARVHCDLGDSVRVRGCAGSLNQVLVNLLVNAAQATRGRDNAEIRISTRTEGDRSVVLVRDDGVGICRGHLSRIFDAGFTTKPCEQGTGFGLFISRKIAAAHGGKLEADSVEGAGSCFRLELPVAGSPSTQRN